MQPSPSQEIIERVFQIIADLKSRKEISGLSQLCVENGFNLRRYAGLKLKTENLTKKDYKTIEVEFIYVLSKKYNASLNWIFHGIGTMYKKLPKS